MKSTSNELVIKSLEEKISFLQSELKDKNNLIDTQRKRMQIQEFVIQHYRIENQTLKKSRTSDSSEDDVAGDVITYSIAITTSDKTVGEHYDQCQPCYNKSTTPKHPHQLKSIPVDQQNELTETQRKERQKSLQLHMQLLHHAATCVSPECSSANCAKMKGLLKHKTQCQIKPVGECHVCKRVCALLQIHARQCEQSQCPVPHCMAIRERFRQLKQQQQAMDDRRQNIVKY